MYVQDYDETMPYSAYFAGTCVATYYWAVTPYVKNDQINVCPSEAQAMKLTDLVGIPCASTPPWNSYAVNGSLFVNGFIPGAAPIALAAIPRPAETIMTYDGNVGFGPANSQVQVVQGRHSEQFNANSVDGHAKSIKANLFGTIQQFTVMGPGKTLKTWKVGAGGGYYANMIECNGIPQ